MTYSVWIGTEREYGCCNLGYSVAGVFATYELAYEWQHQGQPWVHPLTSRCENRDKKWRSKEKVVAPCVNHVVRYACPDRDVDEYEVTE